MGSLRTRLRDIGEGDPRRRGGEQGTIGGKVDAAEKEKGNC